MLKKNGPNRPREATMLETAAVVLAKGHAETRRSGENQNPLLARSASLRLRVRFMNLRVVAAAAALAALALPAFPQSVILNNPGTKPTFAIRNATIYPVTSAPIANGTIVFSKGLITAVGANVAVPSDAVVIDGTGLSVYPGLIDSGSSVGLLEVNSVAGTVDTSELGDMNPNAQAAVALNPHSNLIPVTRVNGITTVIARPQGGVVSGQGALIQLSGWTPAEMVLKAPIGMYIDFPRLRSGGDDEEPQDAEAAKETKKGYTQQLDKLRDLIRDARAYAVAGAARAKDPAVKRFDRDLVLEALVPVVEGREPVVVQANTARDIRAAIKLMDELKLKMILSQAQEVAQVISALKSRNIPVILGPILALPSREDDPYDLLFSNAAALHQAGIRFAIQSGDSHNARNLPYHAAACAAFGLPKDEALKSVTINAAEIFGVADRIGSLEVGKIANVILTDGDPLEIRTHVKRLFIGGEDISLETHDTLLYEKFKKRP
jgi:imidazolonepropionase-like amidohydrolase